MRWYIVHCSLRRVVILEYWLYAVRTKPRAENRADLTSLKLWDNRQRCSLQNLSVQPEHITHIPVERPHSLAACPPSCTRHAHQTRPRLHPLLGLCCHSHPTRMRSSSACRLFSAEFCKKYSYRFLKVLERICQHGIVLHNLASPSFLFTPAD